MAALPFVFRRRSRVERKRVAGRFVREGLDGDGGVQRVEKKASTVSGATNGPRPKYCRTFTRAKVAEALPAIVEKFVEEAKKGSIAHAKMLANLGGLDKGEIPERKPRRRKSVVGRLLENLAKQPVE
jgi:hypothetical protein